jgi:outer membrane protein assembly factor BamA
VTGVQTCALPIFPAFYTDAEFVKLLLQQTHNLSLGRRGVLSASLRLGGIEAFRRLETDPSDPLSGYPSRNVFISERLFAGGAATHRAFGLDELGILGETLFPKPGSTKPPLSDPLKLGGNGLALFNLEYRFPIFGLVGGTAFFDSGNVWADWRRIDPNELRHGVGLGVRFVLPIGPVGVGVGWKLDRKEGESPYEIYINVGNPF